MNSSVSYVRQRAPQNGTYLPCPSFSLCDHPFREVQARDKVNGHLMAGIPQCSPKLLLNDILGATF